MDLEYAIKLLHPDTTGEAIAEIEYYRGFSGKKAAICAIEEALELACEAMGKRVPKKPKESVVYEYCVDWMCPTCERFHRTEWKTKCCSECGQAILWESE